MIKNHSNIIKILLLVFIFSACEDADDIVLKTSGVYIYHEGAFGSSNANIGNYEPETYAYNSSLYRGQNGSFIGDVLQNVLVDNGNDRIYGVLNGSNSIDLMTSNLKSEETLRFPELDKPRDIAVSGDLAFIANWGPYDQNFALTNSSVFVVNLVTNEIVDKIETQEYPEHLLIKDNKLIVSHASFDGSIRELTIIDVDNLRVEGSIEMPSGPQEVVEDENGDIWVVCTTGALIQLNTSLTSIASKIDLDNGVLGDIDSHENAIYFYSAGEISYINIADQSITATGIEVAMQTPYAFAVDPISGDFYLGDAKDFASEGLVIRYSSEGELLDTFESGIAPTQFSFNISRDR